MPPEMSVGQDCELAGDWVTAGTDSVVSCRCALVVLVAVAVVDGRPRAAQLKPPVKSVMLVQLVAFAMLYEKIL